MTATTTNPTPTPDSSAPTLLRVSHLTKRFGDRTAVSDVSFHIDAGETYGLLGPNGAGKSTTISMIIGVLQSDSGEVTVDGTPISTTTTGGRSAIGVVPQEIAIYPDLTARENLRFFGSLYGLAKATLAARVDEVLEVIGLTDRAGDRSGEFSGGMQRRLNIGIGLLHGPKLLILDEPTVGVDPQSRNAILTSVEDLGRSGLAVLYTTHYMEEADRLCDRVGIIDAGQIVAEGTRRELRSRVGGQDTISIELDGDVTPLIEAVRATGGILAAGAQGNTLQVTTVSVADTLPRLLDLAAHAGRSPRTIEVTEPDLEAVFLHLTGRGLRDQ